MTLARPITGCAAQPDEVIMKQLVVLVVLVAVVACAKFAPGIITGAADKAGAQLTKVAVP